MAHTDACKYQVCQLLSKLVENGASIREASKLVQDESDGIPAETIRRWWLQIKSESEGRFISEPPQEQQTKQEVRVEPVVPQPIRLSKETIVEEIDRMVDSGMSIRESAKVLATKVGRSNSQGIRRTYAKVKEAANTECKAQFAWQFAKVAIYQLERIPKGDEDRIKALTEVRDWINNQEGM